MNHTTEKPAPAGVVWLDEGVEFSVAIPRGKRCVLNLYRSKKERPYRSIEMKEDILYGDIRSSGLQKGIREGDEYLYLIERKDGQCLLCPGPSPASYLATWVPEDCIKPYKLKRTDAGQSGS